MDDFGRWLVANKDLPTGEFIDADTIKRDGKRMRLQGIQAPEVGHQRSKTIFTPGQDVGETQAMYDLARSGGYDQAVPTGKVDDYGREVVDLVDRNGSSLSSQAVRVGLVRPDAHTDSQTLRDRSMVKAVSLLFENTPEEQKDPALRIGERMEQTRREAGIRAFPRVEAENEAQRAALKGLVGEEAIRERLEEIARIDKILADDGDIFGQISPEKRLELQEKKKQFQQEIMFAATTNDFVSGGVRNRHGDRDLNNRAKDQVWTSFWNGTLDILNGFGGIAELAGDKAKWEGMSKWGREYQNKIKGEQADLPSTISLRDVTRELSDGEKSWNDIATTGQYAVNLIAGSLPMMAGMLATSVSAAAVGAPAFAVTAGAGALTYAGQFYANQPDDKKNATVALSGGLLSGVLDTLGFKAVTGATSLFREADRQLIKQALVDTGKATSLSHADKLLADATKKEILQLSGDAHRFARAQFASREAKIAAASSVAKASLEEGVTESLQQAVQMLSETGEPSSQQRFDKGFYEGLIEAAIGGGLAGGAINTAGRVRDNLMWRTAASASAERRVRASEGRTLQAALLSNNQNPTVAAQLQAAELDAQANPNLQRSGVEKDLLALPSAKGTWSQLVRAVTHPLDFFRQLGTAITPSITKDDGTFRLYRGIIKAMMVPGVLLGDTFDGLKQKVISEWGTPDRATLATRLGTNEAGVDTLLRDEWQNTWSQGRQSQNPILQGWWDNVSGSTRRMASLLRSLGLDPADILSSEDAHSVFTDASIDVKQIARNRQRLIDALVARGETQTDAETTVNKLIDGKPAEMQIAREVLGRTGILMDSQFNDLFHGRTLESFENLKSRVANKVAKQVYLGQRGEKLAMLLQMAHENGEFESEAERMQVTRDVQDWYRIIEGQYHSLADKPALEKAVAWGSTGAMMAYLSKAALSSLAELSFAILGTPAEKILKQLSKFAQTFIQEVRDDVNRGTSYTSSKLGMALSRSTARGRDLDRLEELREALDNARTVEEALQITSEIEKLNEKIMGRSLFERLGYNDSGYNSQAKFETNTVNAQRAMGVFSRMILLRAQNDANRIALLSMASDILRTHIQALQAIPAEDRLAMLAGTIPMTGYQQEAVALLTSYGADIISLLHAFDELDIKTEAEYNHLLVQFGEGSTGLSGSAGEASTSTHAILNSQLSTVLTNMVNSHIASPGTSNIPKFYHDPRLRVFTVMQRFIATFTATVLPRLYRDYLRDGHAGMKFSAFSVLVSALLIGHMANMLKDLVGYGDDDNPYIKSNSKKAQRALYASGLLGSAQGLLDRAIPLYPRSNRKDEGSIEKAYQTLKGESPVLSWGDNIVAGMYGVSTAQTPKEMERGAARVLRSAPLIGSIPVAGKETAQVIAGTSPAQ